MRVASLIAQHGVLAAILAGLILAGILAATMSTADSQMLAAASSVSQNILQEFGHMKLSEKQSLFAARLTIICISVVGVVLARDPNSSVFGIVSLCMGRVRRLIWRGDALFAVLEVLQLAGCSGLYALRRSDGLCMEVHHQPAGRRVWHLRAAACLPDVSGGLRCGEPCYPGSLGRDRSRVRRCQVKTIKIPYAKEQSLRALLFCLSDEVAEETAFNSKDQPCFAAWKQKSKTEKEQKIQHEPHQTGKRRAERHGMNDKKIHLTPAPVVTGLLKIVPELKR